MDRRDFLIRAGVAFPAIGGALYISGCDSNSSSNNLGNNGGNNGNNGGNNDTMVLSARSSTDRGHSHSAEIPEDDLTSSTSQTYRSTNSGGHAHNVVLSASQLQSLAENVDVTVTSSNDAGHSHTFTFSKVG